MHTPPSTCRPIGLRPSFGFGDRLGVATPGHVGAMRQAGAGIAPVFAQQSIREMQRTDRCPEQVIAAALWGATLAGWTDPFGADADHLQSTADLERTAQAGFTFYTLDPSSHVHPGADQLDEGQLRQQFHAIRPQVPWFDVYRGQSVPLDTGTVITLTEEARMRAAVKYGAAIAVALYWGRHLAEQLAVRGTAYELELSVDETPQPTTLAEHFIIADQCLQAGLPLISLAPRFPGQWEKGVDFQGHVGTFATALRDHAALARQLGPYKLSLHSGSDKLSIYPLLARATGGLFHVKTAGTSYLEALRVAAHHAPALFREIIAWGRQHYATERATYQVSAHLDHLPPADADLRSLERAYLGWAEDLPPGAGFSELGRQVLHCTYGSVLTHAGLGAALRDCLQSHAATYADFLRTHFARHLQALQTGLP